MAKKQSWNFIYNKYVRKGHDRADAAYRADEYERLAKKRNKRPSKLQEKTP